MLPILFDRFSIDTVLSPAQASQKLSRHVRVYHSMSERIKASVGRLQDGKTFEGQVKEDGFRLRRIIAYRNSFLPVIQGRFEAGVQGTQVIVQMRIPIPCILFLIFWCLALSRVALLVPSEHGVNIVPWGMVAFGFVIALIGFEPERRIARKRLREIFSDQSSIDPAYQLPNLIR